jgi:hypothetical protein
MLHPWKAPNIVKGMLTWVPLLNAWRSHHASTGNSDSARYCYAVWLRHLTVLNEHGFDVKGARIGELGPGDSLGVGLSALLAGAATYVGLDLLPFSSKADSVAMLDELAQLFSRREQIPEHEFPTLRPKLHQQTFPDRAIDWTSVAERVKRIRTELRAGVNSGPMVQYRAPWTSHHVSNGSLDLVLSQAVLQHVDPLEQTYRNVFAWLKPGGYTSHAVSCAGLYLSPFWNGHWAYSDRQWQLVRGKREFLLNREPLSTHLRLAQQVGFQVLHAGKEYGEDGLPAHDLASRFQSLDPEDRRTRFVMLVLQKPC